MTDVAAPGQDLTPSPDAPVEPSPEQKRHVVYKHPERERIEALLRHGKSSEWIALWLEDEYPIEDDDGQPHPNKRAHERQHLDPGEIEGYRARFLSQYAAGFDILSPELEDAIGRRFPAPKGPNFEIEIVEAGIRVAEINLARGMEADEELEMLQPTTLQAQAQLIEAATASADLKSSLGVPGYEPPPERVEIDQRTTSMSMELQGRVDAQGNVIATEPEKLKLLRRLMEMPPEHAAAAMAAAGGESDTAQAPPVTDPVVDSTATEIPVDEELDGRAGEPGGGPGADGGGEGGGGAPGSGGGDPGGDPA